MNKKEAAGVIILVFAAMFIGAAEGIMYAANEARIALIREIPDLNNINPIIIGNMQSYGPINVIQNQWVAVFYASIIIALIGIGITVTGAKK